MRVVVCGSREITDSETIFKVLDEAPYKITELVSGGARGVDTIAEDWARARGIEIKQFVPDWVKHGKSAGFIRNREMVKYADAAIAFWNGSSRGTESTIRFARREHKPVFLMVYDGLEWRKISSV